MIKPIGDRIIVLNIEEKEITKSGIILKDSSTKSDINKALVIEVSDDVKIINKDDHIFYSQYKGEVLRIDEKEYVILEVKDVLGKEI